MVTVPIAFCNVGLTIIGIEAWPIQLPLTPILLNVREAVILKFPSVLGERLPEGTDADMTELPNTIRKVAEVADVLKIPNILTSMVVPTVTTLAGIFKVPTPLGNIVTKALVPGLVCVNSEVPLKSKLVAPGIPVGPVGPVAPKPVGPVGPLEEPVGPIDPVGPVTPVPEITPVSYTHLTLPTNREV